MTTNRERVVVCWGVAVCRQRRVSRGEVPSRAICRERERRREKKRRREREVPTGRGVERMISEEVKGETGWSKGSMMNEGMWCL